MTLLKLLLRESRGILALSIVAGAIGGATGVALIALIQAELARTAAPSWKLGLAFAVLCIVSAATRVVAQSALVRLGQESVSKLCVFLSRKILALPLEAFEEANPSGLIAVLTEDIVLVANALVGIPLIAINLPLVAACLAYVGWLSPPLLWSGALFAALAIAIYLALGARAMRHLHAARGKKDLLVSHMRSMIEGFRELKLHRGRREAFVFEAIEPATGAVQRETSAGLALYAAAEGWSQMAFFGFVGYLLFLAPMIVGVGRPTLAGVVLVVLYIMSPLDVILTWLPILGRAQASIGKIHKLLPDLEARGSDPPAGSPLDPIRDSLTLEGVTYSYRAGPDEEAFALGPVDLTLRPGEVVFLVGGNGSGKTTLVKLLAGLYPPTGGQVRVDEAPVRDESRESYRQLFSVVFADGYLFKDLLGLDDADLADRAIDGLARLELAGRVTFEGRSYSTTDLSQGQRRRLALLTACLEDRPVCVFDEWAANQDPHFKGVFYRQILPDLKAQGKTILVITHDEEFYPLADRVVRLQDGRIVESDLAPVGNGTV